MGKPVWPWAAFKPREPYCVVESLTRDCRATSTIRCNETNEVRHIIVIASFDGITYWTYVIEERKFAIFTFSHNLEEMGY